MRTSDLAKLTHNDGQQQLVSKINANFEKLRKSLEDNVRSGAALDMHAIGRSVSPSIEADVIASVMGIVFPIGIIIAFSDGSTPASKGLPGTWVRVLEGRYPIGADSGHAPGSLLGESEVPRHRHGLKADTVKVETSTAASAKDVLSADPTHTSYTEYEGSADPDDILPPSTAVAFWRRTA